MNDGSGGVLYIGLGEVGWKEIYATECCLLQKDIKQIKLIPFEGNKDCDNRVLGYRGRKEGMGLVAVSVAVAAVVVVVRERERERRKEEKGKEKSVFIFNSKWVANAIQEIWVACDIYDTWVTDGICDLWNYATFLIVFLTVLLYQFLLLGWKTKKLSKFNVYQSILVSSCFIRLGNNGNIYGRFKGDGK